jgi:FecR protein
MLKRTLGAVPVALAAALAFSLYSVSAFADSQVRIVRLSTVDGNVQIDRNTGQGFERAFLNLPVTQGTKLRIRGEGRAEIEFEDGSTLRIASDTQVEFPQLSLLDSGSKASTVNVASGTAYINFAGAKDNQLTLMFGHEKVAFSRAAHLRLEASRGTAALAVFKGDVQVDAPSGPIEVGKNQTASFDLREDDKSSVAKDIEPNPSDDWDKAQDKYHQRYTLSASNNNNNNNVSPYAFGMSDMGYYGNFFNAPGYGMMWQPYLTGAGWDPFMDGAWAFSPGMGYGWVSAYPWGWTPYHYGSWAFVPSYGWAWQPGGAWSSFGALPRIVNAPRNFAAPQPPTAGRSTVVVNRGPASTLAARSTSKLLVRNNSAGLGIPRGGVNNLTKISQSVQQGGAVSARVHAVPMTPMPSRDLGRPASAPRSSFPASRPMPSQSPSSSPAPHGGAPAHK